MKGICILSLLMHEVDEANRFRNFIFFIFYILSSLTFAFGERGEVAQTFYSLYNNGNLHSLRKISISLCYSFLLSCFSLKRKPKLSCFSLKRKPNFRLYKLWRKINFSFQTIHIRSFSLFSILRYVNQLLPCNFFGWFDK